VTIVPFDVRGAAIASVGAPDCRKNLEATMNENEITQSLTGGVTLEERHRLISEAAFYRAEQRGFIEGFELEDWLAAEAEIDARIGPRASEAGQS
jgi:hypothetical protein